MSMESVALGRKWKEGGGGARPMLRWTQNTEDIGHEYAWYRWPENQQQFFLGGPWRECLSVKGLLLKEEWSKYEMCVWFGNSWRSLAIYIIINDTTATFLPYPLENMQLYKENDENTDSSLNSHKEQIGTNSWLGPAHVVRFKFEANTVAQVCRQFVTVY